MRNACFVGSLALLSIASPWRAIAGGDDASPPDEKTYKRWLEMVVPTADESRWKKLGWRSELWSAAQEAKTLQRPILLWAMNGHPLGCT